MKKLCILGSTGSIGTQTLEIVRRHPDKFSVSAMTCGHNINLFREQLNEFKPCLAVCADECDALSLKKEFPRIEFLYGTDGICKAAESVESDIVVNSLLGMMGLKPTMSAVKSGHNIAFANKETLIAGGKIIVDAVKKSGIKFLPVDSEHSAIFQSIQGQKSEIAKILLTASGGPFRGYSADRLRMVTKADALKHPNWSMGAKITIDSATMMNKGLEIIEASLLFDVPPDKVEVYVHLESILHSAVAFSDGAVIGQMGIPDMKIPIAYALSYPDRLDNISPAVDLFSVGVLHFERPDTNVFRCLKLAYSAIKSGHIYQIAMNAANEEAVDAFLKDRISFTQIADVVEETLNKTKPYAVSDVDDIYYIDKESRHAALNYINKLQ